MGSDHELDMFSNVSCKLSQVRGFLLENDTSILPIHRPAESIPCHLHEIPNNVGNPMPTTISMSSPLWVVYTILKW